MGIVIAAVVVSVVVFLAFGQVASAVDRLASTQEKTLEYLETISQNLEKTNFELEAIGERLKDFDDRPSGLDIEWERQHEGGSLYASRVLLRQIHKELKR